MFLNKTTYLMQDKQKLQNVMGTPSTKRKGRLSIISFENQYSLAHRYASSVGY